MLPGAMLAVLLGAVLHASWNVLVKRARDKLADTVLVAAGGTVCAVMALPFLPTPAIASWPFIAVSGAIHVAYFLLVAAAYRTGDMSYAYPLMRGTAPLLVAVASAVAFAEMPSGRGWLGILLICSGVLAVALAPGRPREEAHAPSGRTRVGTTTFALMNAVVIAGYTIVDGIGARTSGHPVAYTVWLIALTGLPVVAVVGLMRGSDYLAHALRRWPVGLGGGACTLGSYALALWAMTQMPVALVAALRETSILFGTAFAAVFLKERVTWTRYAAAASVLGGAVALRFA